MPPTPNFGGVLWKTVNGMPCVKLYTLLTKLLNFIFHTDTDNHSHKYGLLQYLFDGPEVDIKVKPHGNSKKASPFFRTARKQRNISKNWHYLQLQ